MTTTISDYPNVAELLANLGCTYPEGVALLPINFESATSIAEFKQVSEASTVKTLLRNASIPYGEIFDRSKKPPYVQNNSFEWIAPTIFVSAGLISGDANYISVALNVISNYATDFFKGISGGKSIKLEVVIEKTKSKTCKKITYQGDVDGLKNLPEIIREIADE
ncbi:hypothetical protein [Dechloromonas sp. CZR5]|uniref:hypothetical protein n=1 Tax=Dechloromonas sp. CZR5 TaxID=2608630 RepID=UPI00123CCA0F|nr:hypothetical protein [Dechloromonas sp. CZR5]